MLKKSFTLGIIALVLSLMLSSLILPAVALSATTMNLTAMTGDGHLYSSAVTWNAVRSADTAPIDNSNTKVFIDSTWDGSKFLISRGFLFFNSTNTPSYLDVATVQLYVYIESKTTYNSDAGVVFLAQTTSHPNYPLQQLDYDRGWYTTAIGSADMSDLTAGQYNYVSLSIGYWLGNNAIANIEVMTSLDYNNAAPDGANTLVIGSAESAHPPYLKVTYGSGASGTVSSEDLNAIKTQLTAIQTQLTGVVNAQSALSTKLIAVDTDIKNLPNTSATVNTISSNVASILKTITTQDKNITSIMNQLGTLPAMKTDLGKAMDSINQVSENLTLGIGDMQTEVNGLKDAVKPSSTSTVLLVIVMILLAINLIVTIKVSRSAI